MTKLWNNLDVSTQIMVLPEFKMQLKKDLKPTKYRHFSKGSKLGSSLLSRIRINRSDLNLHKFEIGFLDTPACSCHAKSESSIHYIMDCFLYSGERQISGFLFQGGEGGGHRAQAACPPPPFEGLCPPLIPPLYRSGPPLPICNWMEPQPQGSFTVEI